MSRSLSMVIGAVLFSLLVPALGYIYLGPLYAALFLVGYLGGLIGWLSIAVRASWMTLRAPYWLTMLAFLFLHKVEENRTAFFEVVSSEITGVPVPRVTTGLIVGLLILPVGAWLLVPLLIRRGQDSGYYLAWTFFASMGITELAHFFLPLLTSEPYGYFPGMASVVALAPLGWWGMWRLSGRSSRVRAGW